MLAWLHVPAWRVVQVELLREAKSLRATIHLTRWQVEAAELRAAHSTAHLTDLQLLHVSKEMLEVMRDPSAIAKLNEEATAVAMVAATQRLHAHKVASRQRALARLQEQVGWGGGGRLARRDRAGKIETVAFGPALRPRRGQLASLPL